MSEYFITTSRLGFRTWSEGDVALALGLWGDPAVTRLIDARGMLTKEQVRERLAREIAVQQQFGIQYWPVFILEDGSHVGCCGLRPHGIPMQEQPLHGGDKQVLVQRQPTSKTTDSGWGLVSTDMTHSNPISSSNAALEIGFHIRSAYWGQGFATEAARAVAEYAFRTLGVKALFAGHNPKNVVSRRVLERLGFRYTHDELYPPTGLMHPSYLLRAEDFAVGV